VQTLTIELTASSINHGRIYFEPSHIGFFPRDALGEREGEGDKGSHVRFHTDVDVFDTDIRRFSSQRLSPRVSFKRYLKAVGAKPGDSLKVTRRSERDYEVEYIGRRG